MLTLRLHVEAPFIFEVFFQSADDGRHCRPSRPAYIGGASSPVSSTCAIVDACGIDKQAQLPARPERPGSSTQQHSAALSSTQQRPGAQQASGLGPDYCVVQRPRRRHAARSVVTADAKAADYKACWRPTQPAGT